MVDTEPVNKERVYCYELYHQMRCQMHGSWPECPRIILTGEVDKQGYKVLDRLDIGYPKPDLLIHEPGAMNNLAVIEVKRSREFDVAGVRKDLEVLSNFVTRLKYRRAIHLTFGNEAAGVVSKIEREAEKIQDKAMIEIWVHTDVGSPAEQVKCIETGPC